MLEKKTPQYFTAGSLGRVGDRLDLQLLPVAMVSIFPPRMMSTHQPSALTKKGKWWGYCFCPGSPERVTCESPLSTQMTMAEDYSDCTPHLRLRGQGMFKIPLQFSPSVTSDSLQPHGLQHTRLPCPPPTPGAYSNPCPSSWWCHPTISSSVVPFSSCLQSFPASGSFKMSQLFASSSQSIGVSASASVLPKNIQDWSPLGWTLKSPLQHHSSEASILRCSAFFIVQLSHPYMTTGKTIVLTRWTFVGKVMSMLFNMLSRLVITFLSRSKSLLISWLQSPSAVILEPPKIKSVTVSPSICHEVMGPNARSH